MSNVRITPPFGVTGLWKLKAPYRAKPAKVYTCTAIRSFVELELLNINIHFNYYAPHELSEEVYRRDLDLGASMVVLLGTDGERIYVPDTYIESYPDMNIGDYKRFILSCELGTLPANTAIEHIKSAIAMIVQEKLGRAPKVELYIGPIAAERLTPSELKREENVRKTNVTNTKTTYGQLYETSRRLGDLEGYVKVLKEQLKNKDQVQHDHDQMKARFDLQKKELDNLKSQSDVQQSEIRSLTQENEERRARIALLERTITQLGGAIP